MKKSRFTKCVFLVFWPLGAIVYCFRGPWRACWCHLQECHEPNNEKNMFYKVWLFSFLAFKGRCVLFWGGPGGHVGVIFKNATNPTMKKPRFTKCVFFVFWPLMENMLGSSSGMPRTQQWKNHVLQSVFFHFLAFRGHCVLFWGALEGMLGSSSECRMVGYLEECHEPNNEKNTFYKVCFFRFLAFRSHCVRNATNPTMKKTRFTKCIPCEITRVTSGRAFCNTKRRDCLQNDVFVFFQLCSNIENHLSKKFRPYKMAWLEEHNFIPSHPKAMSKTKMAKHQITTKWNYWNVPILQKTPALKKQKKNFWATNG